MKWLAALNVICIAVELFLYWRMRKLRAKWIKTTREYEETLIRLGIPRNVL